MVECDGKHESSHLVLDKTNERKRHGLHRQLKRGLYFLLVTALNLSSVLVFRHLCSLVKYAYVNYTTVCLLVKEGNVSTEQ